MKKCILLFAILVNGCFCINAQIKYYGYGKIAIGNVTNDPLFPINIDAWALKMSCENESKWIKFDVSASNPRIYGTGDQIVFYNTQNLQFNSIQVRNVYQQSDLRAKRDILPLQGGIQTLMRLRPITFHWKDTPKSSSLRTYDTGEEMTEMGFIAQEVEKVLPEIVCTDELGNKLINYTAIIPLLVEAIQSLHDEVAELENKVYSDMQEKEMDMGNILYQNQPNPFKNETRISYSLSENVQTASIHIYNMEGSELKFIPINTRGKGTVIINRAEFKAGIYLYTLIADNKVIDTKQMVLTNE